MALPAPLVSLHEEVEPFYLVAGPRRLAQELQAGRNAGVAGEATHRNAPAQLVPPIVRHQRSDDGFKGEAMQGVAWLAGC